MKLYKILRDGRSCHGGTMAWSLPTSSGPGDWHDVSGTLRVCVRGLHLTHFPETWWSPGCQVFEAEADGVVVGADNGTKVVASRVRLVRRASWVDYVSARGIRALRGPGIHP